MLAKIGIGSALVGLGTWLKRRHDKKRKNDGE